MSHIDQPGEETVWLEISVAKSTPILAGFCYRNSASLIDWMDAFIEMMDRFTLSSKEFILLDDFKADLKKTNQQWKNCVDSYNLHQLVKSPIRMTQKPKTLIDYI